MADTPERRHEVVRDLRGLLEEGFTPAKIRDLLKLAIQRHKNPDPHPETSRR